MKDEDDKKEDIENEDDIEDDKKDDVDEDLEDDEDLKDSLEDADESEDEDDEDSEDDDEDEKEDQDFDEKDLDDPEKRKVFLEEFKKSKSSMKQRAIWKRRALKAGWSKEKQQKAPDAKPPKKKIPANTQNQETLEEARRLNELTEFRLDHSDLPRRMVRQIQKYALANQMSMNKAMKQPLIQKFVNDKQLREKLSKASTGSRHRSPQTAPPKNWDTATSAEVAAHEAEVRRRVQNRK